MKVYHSREEVIQDHQELQEELQEELNELNKGAKKETLKKGAIIAFLCLLIFLLTSLLTGNLRISSSTFQQGYIVRLNGQEIDYQLHEVRNVVLLPFRIRVKKVYTDTMHQITNQVRPTFSLGNEVTLSLHFYTCLEGGKQIECQNKLLDDPEEQEIKSTMHMTIIQGKKTIYKGDFIEQLRPYLTEVGSYQIIIKQPLETGTSKVTLSLYIN